MKTRILLVDDHKVFRDGLRKLLSDQPDFEVVGEAADGLTAQSLAAELTPDLVVMDISMPGLNGIDATRALRKLPSPPKVIILSMHTDRRFVSMALQAGVAGYILKEAAFEDLAQAARVVRTDGVFFSPKVASIVAEDYRLAQQNSGNRDSANLTERERSVLQLLAEGRSTKDIGTALHISTKTVETHRRNIMLRLKITSLADLIKYSLREGLTDL